MIQGVRNKLRRLPTFPRVSAVSSARGGLTALFGMGRGEHPRYDHLQGGEVSGAGPAPFRGALRGIVKKAVSCSAEHQLFGQEQKVEPFEQLVRLGFAFSGFTPVAYRRLHLRRLSAEDSSWGEFRT